MVNLEDLLSTWKITIDGLLIRKEYKWLYSFFFYAFLTYAFNFLSSFSF